MVCLSISAGTMQPSSSSPTSISTEDGNLALTPRWACTGEERLARASCDFRQAVSRLTHLSSSEIQASGPQTKGEPGCDAYLTVGIFRASGVTIRLSESDGYFRYGLLHPAWGNLPPIA